MVKKLIISMSNPLKLKPSLQHILRRIFSPILSFFSTLLPIHDTIIFRFLASHTSAIPFTHSCNFRKPWCLRCPKCCYVWLSYSAYFPQATVRETFGEENVLDLEENQVFFYQMLGLGKQKPFEAIGQIEEAQLAFALCRSKGLRGKAMKVFEEKVAAQFDTEKLDIISKFAKVYRNDIGIPQLLADKILTKLEEVSTKFQDEVQKLL